MPKSLTEHWTDEELAELPPRRPPEMWNPFAEVVGHPVDGDNARRWFPLHDGPGGGPARTYDPSAPYDPLEGLLDALGDAPMHVVTDPKTGEVTAVFLMRNAQPTRQQEDEWEQRAHGMHRSQTTIDVADLPERTMEEPGTLNRPTFHSQLADDAVPKFEDLSPEERRRLTRRGD